MIKTILVPANGTETDAASYVAALPILRGFGAHLDALHVRVDPVEVAVAMTTEGAGGTLLDGIIEGLTREADDAEAKARAMFEEFCRRESLLNAAEPGANGSPSAQFNVKTGQQTRWMTALGTTADLAVAARGSSDDPSAGRATLEALLLETGRPLLIPGIVAPAGGEFTQRVSIAWKPTPQAARAVAYAMPLLLRAKDVAVLTVDEEESGPGAAQRLVRYLGWHGVNATATRLTADAKGGAAALLGAARTRGGLLVMGGYGHTRLREWVFGGFTASVLDHADIPVLMAH
ncbi:MAG TPA: universal stress protein [Stellaceae bacterium]|nr:universal stress protein [Stellaceae bacterium]